MNSLSNIELFFKTLPPETSAILLFILITTSGVFMIQIPKHKIGVRHSKGEYRGIVQPGWRIRIPYIYGIKVYSKSQEITEKIQSDFPEAYSLSSELSKLPHADHKNTSK